MFSRNDAFLWEDKEREEDGEEGEQQKNWEVDEVSRGGHKGDEARLVGGDLSVDPGLVLWYPSVDSWEIGLSAAFPKAHHSSLDPNGAVFNHQWASRVTLHTSDMVVIVTVTWIFLFMWLFDCFCSLRIHTKLPLTLLTESVFKKTRRLFLYSFFTGAKKLKKSVHFLNYFTLTFFLHSTIT